MEPRAFMLIYTIIFGLIVATWWKVKPRPFILNLLSASPCAPNPLSQWKKR
jgi:hypothetical protein